MKYDKSNKTEHDIKKDGLDESQPSGGKSAEEVKPHILNGSDEDLAVEIIARYSQSSGRNGRITKMLKEAFVDGSVWMKGRLQQHAHQQPDGYSREQIIDNYILSKFGDGNNALYLDSEQLREALRYAMNYPFTQQPVNDGWVRVEERLPIEKDCDENGNILALDNKRGKKEIQSLYRFNHGAQLGYYTHWHQLPPRTT